MLGSHLGKWGCGVFLDSIMDLGLPRQYPCRRIFLLSSGCFRTLKTNYPVCTQSSRGSFSSIQALEWKLPNNWNLIIRVTQLKIKTLCVLALGDHDLPCLSFLLFITKSVALPPWGSEHALLSSLCRGAENLNFLRADCTKREYSYLPYSS
jgi:hypothetical protein